MRQNRCQLFFWDVSRLLRPPKAGYELSLMPDETSLRDFIVLHREKVVITVIRDHENCPLANKLISVFHHAPFGDPRSVRFAVISAQHAPRIIAENQVLAFPTSLLFFRRQVEEKVVGARPRDLMIKSRFLLRREGKNVFSDGGGDGTES